MSDYITRAELVGVLRAIGGMEPAFPQFLAAIRGLAGGLEARGKATAAAADNNRIIVGVLLAADAVRSVKADTVAGATASLALAAAVDAWRKAGRPGLGGPQ